MKISVCEFTAKICLQNKYNRFSVHTYIHTLYTYNSIYEVRVFLRIMTAHIISVRTLCQMKNTLYKPNAIQTRRLPLIIKYAVHLPATKQNTTVSSGR
jgi:hypothetical protein